MELLKVMILTVEATYLICLLLATPMIPKVTAVPRAIARKPEDKTSDYKVQYKVVNLTILTGALSKELDKVVQTIVGRV